MLCAKQTMYAKLTCQVSLLFAIKGYKSSVIIPLEAKGEVIRIPEEQQNLDQLRRTSASN